MSRVTREAIVPYTCDQMYALVTDISAYDRFLPWCRSTAVEPLADGRVRARLEIRHGGVDLSFATVNRNTPPQSVEMELAEGPFRQLRGGWRFTPLGDDGCKIAFTVGFEFAAPFYRLFLNRFFHRITASLMDAFLERARAVYGQKHGQNHGHHRG